MATPLTPLGKHSTIEVADEQTFYRALDAHMVNRALFDAQGAEHADIDLRLVEKIEDLLVPTLGRWERSATWHHQMDWYGDGIRCLTFRRDIFPTQHLLQLQALLVGEHRPFAIVCIVADQLLSSDTAHPQVHPDDYLALLSSKVIVTRPLAEVLRNGA